MMNEILKDENLIAYCGLYCAACGAYLNGKCLGCKKSQKNLWCKVKKCNISKGQKSCADCKDFDDYKNCKNLNNFISKIFGLIFKSNRIAGINMIKQKGYSDFAEFMTQNKLQSIKRK